MIFIHYPKYLQVRLSILIPLPFLEIHLISQFSSSSETLDRRSGSEVLYFCRVQSCNKRSLKCRRQLFCIESTVHEQSPKPQPTSPQPNSTLQNKTRKLSHVCSRNRVKLAPYLVLSGFCQELNMSGETVRQGHQSTAMKEASAHLLPWPGQISIASSAPPVTHK